jgi:hypothetical protein
LLFNFCFFETVKENFMFTKTTHNLQITFCAKKNLQIMVLYFFKILLKRIRNEKI